jgi:uncharacterized protein (UPF0332 family)
MTQDEAREAVIEGLLAKADYTTLARFEMPNVREKISQAEAFVAEMKRLLEKSG